jgi:hypothetical protein
MAIIAVVVSEPAQSGSYFISYHLYTPSPGGISAYCDATSPQSKWAGYITANSLGLPCNSCVKMTSQKTGKYIYAFVVDKGGRGFDLNQPAFCELCGEEGGFAQGGCNINYEVQSSITPCNNWIAGKTKPWCDLCPTGSTCGNPDPNRNLGVDWNIYCPSFGSSDGMTRCFMRIDGCTCYGGTSSPPLPPPPTQNPPPPPPPTTSNGNRCGTSWSDADSKCSNAECPGGTDGECPSGQFCYAGSGIASCGTAAIGESSAISDNGMGMSPTVLGLIVAIAVVGLALIIVSVLLYKKTKVSVEERA